MRICVVGPYIKVNTPGGRLPGGEIVMSQNPGVQVQGIAVANLPPYDKKAASATIGMLNNIATASIPR